MTGTAGLHEPFDTMARQHEGATLAMWTFLASEVLVFGGLFTGYAVMVVHHPGTAQTMSGELDAVLGGVNTAVLLTSSLSMAIAVNAAQIGAVRLTRGCLALTAALGVSFLAIKALEWSNEAQHRLVPLRGLQFDAPAGAPAAEHFMSWYFALTGLHALHLAVGVVLVAAMALSTFRASWTARTHAIEMTGLYWHLVDIVWVFLYPLVYLLHAGGV